MPLPQVPSRARAGREAHPLEDAMALATIVAGLIAFVTGLIHPAHLAAVVFGAIGFLVGLYSQLVSATTTQRWFNVIGIGAAFVGFGLGLAHGGFTS